MTRPWPRTLARLAVILLAAGAVVVNLWNHWPLAQREVVTGAAISQRDAHAFVLSLHSMQGLADSRGDSIESPAASPLQLLENGIYLGPRHAAHRTVAEAGNGAYSHWGGGVIFSASDNSDPRTNGRTYEVRYSLGPARWLLELSRIALLAAVALLCWLSPRPLREIAAAAWRACAAAALPATLALAVAATLTRFFPVPGELITEAAVPATQTQAGDFYVDKRSGNVSFLPFERLVAPFMIVASASDEKSPSGLRVRQENAILLEAHNHDEWHSAKGAVFLDLDRIGGDMIVVYLPSGVDERRAPLTIEYRARVTGGATVALWSIFALTLLTGLVARRVPARPGVSRPLILASILLALAGASLLALNVAGILLPKRPGALVHFQNLEVTDPRRTAWAGLAAFERTLARGPDERSEDYVARVNGLVAENIIHLWNYGNANNLHLHVPPWDNYILWALGETDARLYRYHYAAWRPAIERGAGMCSQATLVLVEILRERGYDARVVQLTGHTVATVEVSPGKWHILDPDIDAVIPHSLRDVERDPESIRAIYEDAYRRLEYHDPVLYAGAIVDFYGKAGNYIEPRGGNEMLGEAWGRRERAAEKLKWAIPIGLLGLAGLLAGVALPRRRRAPDPAPDQAT